MDITRIAFPAVGKPAQPMVYAETLYLEQWRVPAGTEVSIYQGKNFGYVILPAGTKDARGFVIPKRVFKY